MIWHSLSVRCTKIQRQIWDGVGDGGGNGDGDGGGNGDGDGDGDGAMGMGMAMYNSSIYIAFGPQELEDAMTKLMYVREHPE